jgi:hypothetical protein
MKTCHFICNFVKKNGEICGSRCQKSICGIHIFNLGFKACLGCEKMTSAKTGFCTVCTLLHRKRIRQAKYLVLS